MKNIKSITKLRFLTENVNGEFITDLTAQEGDKIGVKLVFEDDTEYLIAYNSMVNTAFTGYLITHIAHYTRFSTYEKWNSLDLDLIDKTIFPNLNDLVIGQDLFIDSETGKFYYLDNLFIYCDDLTKEILDENGDSFEPKKYSKKIKPNMLKYYDLMRYSALGLGMENACFDDMTNRLQHLLL